MGIKITEGMIAAGEGALMRCAEDHCLAANQALPDFEGMTPDQRAEGRKMVRAVLMAGADYYTDHGNK